MAVEHIENIEIINFKCFKHLSIKGIGKVNLIGGKNNVGKTAFLEAVELLVSADNAYMSYYEITQILQRRQKQQYSSEYPFELDFNYKNKQSISLESNLKKIEMNYVTEILKDKQLDENDDVLPTDCLSLSVIKAGFNESKLFPIDRFAKRSSVFLMRDRNFIRKSFNYISSAKSDEQNIAILLGSLIELRKEEFLNQSLALFDSGILAIKQIPMNRGTILKLELKNQENLVLLSSLGEGINRYIAILCAIWASKDGVLLIDEIENGIHYTNYKKLWEIIFKTSVEANCQLFITTHSKECIMAFNEAQFEYENSNASYIELYKNKKKDDLITAAVHDKQQLRYELTHEGKVRGE